MTAKRLQIYASIEAVKARMEGMKARNELSRVNGEHPFWNEQDFGWAADELAALSVEAANS